MDFEQTMGGRLMAKNFMRPEEVARTLPPLLTSERPGVLMLTLSRPADLNSLNGDLVRMLHSAIDKAGARDDIRVVVITGTGRAFCTGADLKEAGANVADAADFQAWLRPWKDCFAAFEACPKPVIAALNGITMAGGLELALACDLIVASDAARVGDGHATYGLVPGGGASQRLPDAVGVRMARWLMYTAALLSAEQAREIGLVQQVLPSEGFLDEVWALAESIAARSLPGLAFMKRMTASAQVTDEGLTAELEAAAHVICGPDAREGLAAFVAKRPPVFPSATL
jgi:enoyl-CoA hydratase/carnithine racemase